MNAMTKIAEVASTPSERQDALTSSFSASYAGVMAFITVATEGSFAPCIKNWA